MAHLDTSGENVAPHLSVVIPAYNEARRLPATLDAILDYLARQSYAAEVLVVDDGSADATAALVRHRAASATAPLQLIQHPDGRNHGKGAAVRLGMTAARGRFRLFMDADNAITIDHVERFWPFFERGCPIVIGTCDHQSRNGDIRPPWYRPLASRIGNRVIQALAVPGITNTQTGFKIFTQGCVERVFPRLTIDRWGFDVEILVVCRQLGLPITEVPVQAITQPGSKVTRLAYLGALREVWRVRRNLRGGRYTEH
jgi:dolichyl-phosphate beta-glucosyltransferase